MRYPIWIRNPFYHLFYVDYSIESSHDFRGEQGRRNWEQSVCDCYSLCYVTIILICSWKQTYFNGKSRINTPDSVDSISLLRLINRIGSTPEILNIIITLIALASGTAAILVAIMIIYENIRKWGWVVFYFVFSHCQVPQGKYVFHACFLNF